jgi:hypothetical protein
MEKWDAVERDPNQTQTGTTPVQEKCHFAKELNIPKEFKTPQTGNQRHAPSE